MAIIRRIESERSFDIGGIPSTHIHDGIGQGLQRVGAALTDHAEQTHRMQMRLAEMQQENEDFAQTQELARFKTSFAGRFAELQATMDPKGLDFAKKTMEEFDREANEFLAKVPRPLRPKYDELLKTTRATFGEQAVAAELDRRDKWFATGVAERTNELGAQVMQNPGLFDLSLADGEAFIDATGWSDGRKAEAKKLLRQQLESAKAGYYERVDPDYLLGPHAQSEASSPILRAMEDVESSGNANAVSSKGATGLMQVMPETAREIAAEIGDKNFPASGSTEDIQAYLKQPEVSRRYGAHYFNKMLQRYGGDTEAALVAYNGGPARADKWLNSGRDDSTLPAETREYKRKVLENAATTAGRRARVGEDLPIITRKGAGRVSTPDLSGVQPVVLERFKQVQNAFGRSIPIVSGFRDPERNKKAKGAKSSQHIHGNALDLDVSDMSHAERVELIRTASALGFTGIGVYNNSIHLDVGSRRAWGHSHHSDSIPAWASKAIQEHLAGKAQPQGGLGGEGGVYLHPDFASLPLNERIAIYDRARAASQRRRDAAEQERQAYIKAQSDALDRGIETGEVTSREQILAAGLPDDKTATLLRRFDERNRNDEEARALLGLMATGERLTINPFDGDQRRLAENAYKYLQRMTPPEQMDGTAMAFIEQAGIIPDPVQAQLRAAAEATTAAELSKGLSLADQVERLAPMDFRSFGGGDSVRDKLAIYRDMVNNRGLNGVTAAQRILDAAKPERVASREVLRDKLNTELKNLAITDITNELGYVFGIGAPDVPLLPMQQNVMLSEYRSRFEEHFYATAGNAADAKALAKRDMLQVWKPSKISGTETLMRMAPELYYPAINGGHEYLREDALETAKAYVAEMYPGREVVNVTVLADSRTREDVEAQRPPRYRLLYEFTDETGIPRFDEVLLSGSSGWGVPAEKLRELVSSDAGTRQQSFVEGWNNARAASDELQRQNAAANAAMQQTVGPDWMKARAGEAAREQMRMRQAEGMGEPPTLQDELKGQRQQLLDDFRRQQGG